VRAVYVLEKRPDVSGPGLEEAGRYNEDEPVVALSDDNDAAIDGGSGDVSDPDDGPEE
jgi:hypothetical protein